MAGIRSRLKHAWNAFSGRPEEDEFDYGGGVVHGTVRPDRVVPRFQNERSIISSIYTRIAIDVASVELRHVRLDDERRYKEDIRSSLNECLTLDPNIDQASRALMIDMILSLFDDGVMAVVPVETSLNPNQTGGFDISNMRVGRIVSWYPQHVRVSVYNEQTGRRQEIKLPKRYVAIVENPLYMVMNEPNSTLQRLLRKLHLLDVVDEASSSGKLDLIIQLPYTIKSEARRQQAEQRRKDIEFQLKGSQYGIAYTDGTEKIVQLNRPAENNLLSQITFLTEMLYGELGITKAIMDGTADEAAMINYYNRTIEPLLGAITQAMVRSFLTKTARTQGQWIHYYRDPFKLLSIADIAEIADKFTRNEIASSNDIRVAIGWKPSGDPEADKLKNSNMPAPSGPALSTRQSIEEGDSQNGT